MKKTEYQRIIDRILMPTLLELGFREVKLKGCIKPEVLYRKDNLWFASAWDWRDRYLDLALGHLYWFKDVMPRVIVIGNYSSYSSEIKKISTCDTNYLVKVASAVNSTIGNAITLYENRYDQILSTHLKKRTKYTSVFLAHLGKEVSDAELSAFTD